MLEKEEEIRRRRRKRGSKGIKSCCEILFSWESGIARGSDAPATASAPASSVVAAYGVGRGELLCQIIVRDRRGKGGAELGVRL